MAFVPPFLRPTPGTSKITLQPRRGYGPRPRTGQSRTLKLSLHANERSQGGYGTGENLDTDFSDLDWNEVETFVNLDEESLRYADLEGVNADIIDVEGGDYDLAPKTKKERKRTSNLLSEINLEPQSDRVVEIDDLPPIAEDETTPWVKTAAKAADERKAVDPIAIRVASLTFVTSFLLICSGKSPPQIRAISNFIEEKMYKEHGIEPKRSAGTPNSGWVLLDYGDLIVNVFSPEQRQNYDLEGYWQKGEIMDLADCITAVSAEPAELDVDRDRSLDDWMS